MKIYFSNVTILFMLWKTYYQHSLLLSFLMHRSKTLSANLVFLKLFFFARGFIICEWYRYKELGKSWSDVTFNISKSKHTILWYKSYVLAIKPVYDHPVYFPFLIYIVCLIIVFVRWVPLTMSSCYNKRSQ